jgi:hypothetical protein
MYLDVGFYEARHPGCVMEMYTISDVDLLERQVSFPRYSCITRANIWLSRGHPVVPASERVSRVVFFLALTGHMCGGTNVPVRPYNLSRAMQLGFVAHISRARYHPPIRDPPLASEAYPQLLCL